ncbi:hypothetical protein C0J52_06723 [Blattella germanica]|nr:hypothetical protein C0J52_06723 [Blattella germanica]
MEKETNAKESVDCAEGDENKSKTDSAKLENADECSTVKEKDELVKTGNETEGKSSPVEDIVDPPSASGDDITMKESNEKVADVQPGMKTVKVVLTRKMSTGSNKSTKSESGLKNGDTAKVISTKDKPMLTEDKKVPASTSQSTVASPSVGSRNSTNTPTPPSNTRSTRSQNPEFLARQRTFLQKVHLASNNRIIDDDLLTDDDDDNSKVTSKSSGSMGTSHSEENSVVDNVPTKRKRERSASNGTLSPRIPSPSVTNMLGGSVSANNSGSSSPAVSQMQPATKKRRNTRSDSSGTQQSILGASTGIEASEDRFCWVCHKDGIVMKCATCPRVFHLRCIQLETAPTEDWVCPECMTILHAENVDTRSRAMQLLSLEQLCNLLKFAVSRMKSYSGVSCKR